MSQNLEENEIQDWMETTEFGGRRPTGFSKYLIEILAGSWAIFQFILPKFLFINSVIVRSIHLAFAISLVYLCYPAIKNQNLVEKLKKGPRIFSFLYDSKMNPVDFILAIIAAAAALYLAFDFEGIGRRAGMPIQRDYVFGILLLVLLVDAARRSLGLALPVIATLFIAYSFFSESMPEIIAFQNATVSKVLNKLVLSSQGVFGVPLDVSASTVFLFVLFGAMLDKAGGGKYFTDLAFSLLGRYKGGPAKAAVLASGITGMVSGSSIANTVTTGTFTIPLMKRTGFPGTKAAAVEVAASTNGQLMPPIMGAAAFIIAEYCNLSYFEVVKAAFIPAIVSYIALIFIVHIEATKLGLNAVKVDLPEFWKTFKTGIHFMIPLFFLIYQLVYLRRSASLSAFYAISALMVLIWAKQIFDVRSEPKKYLRASLIAALEIWQSFVMGSKNMMSIGVAVAAAGIIVGIVTLGLGGVITDLIDIISGGSLMLMLLITAIVSLLLGMGLPTTANYIVMASLTAPAIVALSGDLGLKVPLIAAHLFCFYFGILADDTPPVGLAAYAAGAIAKEDPIKVGIQGFTYDMRTALLPFMFIFNTDLLLVGVDSIWMSIVIFFTALIAMFAFSSLVQKWLIVKNSLFDSILLLASSFILFRPDAMDEYTAIGLMSWKIIGIAIFSFVVFSQYMRAKKLS